MDIYSIDEEWIVEMREWMKNNPIDKSQLPPTQSKKEYHPLFGTKHTEETRKLMSIAHSGEKNHMYGIRGKDNPNYGRKRPDLVAMNKAMAGRTVAESTKEKLRQQRNADGNPMFGKKHSEESKKKMAKFGKDNPSYGKKYPQEKVACQYCSTVGGKGLMKRYHGENCKYK